jgi:putative redox protein
MVATLRPVEVEKLAKTVPPGGVLVASIGRDRFEQVLLDGRHVLYADEPAAVGGDDAGPGPYEFLLMALGSCTSMTVGLYAARKEWPLVQTIVRLTHAKAYAEDCADCENPKAMIDRIERRIEFVGALDGEQRARLLDIANKCPVHRTLTAKIDIRTELTPV